MASLIARAASRRRRCGPRSSSPLTCPRLRLPWRLALSLRMTQRCACSYSHINEAHVCHWQICMMTLKGVVPVVRCFDTLLARRVTPNSVVYSTTARMFAGSDDITVDGATCIEDVNKPEIYL